MKLHSKAQLSEKCILVARYDFVPYLIQDEIKDIIIADVFYVTRSDLPFGMLTTA